MCHVSHKKKSFIYTRKFFSELVTRNNQLLFKEVFNEAIFGQ